MHIQRQLEDKIKLYAKHFPAVAILGPRQAGKTTLAQHIIETNEKESIYLDLENPSDFAILNHPLEFFDLVSSKTVIIDEVQRKPDLFPVLRTTPDSKMGDCKPQIRKQIPLILTV
jgi:predicted AAA+ superfamily ATPase